MQRMEISAERCAAELLETIPLLMRTVREQVRSHRGRELSVPQFRTLAFIGRHKGAALSDVAAHLGLTLPAASKLVNGLVSAKLATRTGAASDRRRIALALTAAGRRRHDSARSWARNFFAQKLSSLSRDRLAQIIKTVQALRTIFNEPPKNTSAAFARQSRNGPSRAGV